MRWLTPFRLATYLLILLSIGHTAGGMFGEQSMGTQADAVFAQMKAVHFNLNGSDATWYGFWFGFGLVCSVFLWLSAFVSWRLDGIERGAWRQVEPIAWAFVVANAGNAY